MDASGAFTLRAVGAEDRDWISTHVTAMWGAPVIVVHGVTYAPGELSGFVAEANGHTVGLITYQIVGEQCEIVTLDSMRPSIGVGSALIDAVRDVANAAGCSRLWLITTNDNLHALGFYQKRGFALVAVHRDAVTQARQIKPEIPLIGDNGIPLRDEIELELPLAAMS